MISEPEKFSDPDDLRASCVGDVPAPHSAAVFAPHPLALAGPPARHPQGPRPCVGLAPAREADGPPTLGQCGSIRADGRAALLARGPQWTHPPHSTRARHRCPLLRPPPCGWIGPKVGAPREGRNGDGRRSAGRSDGRCVRSQRPYRKGQRNRAVRPLAPQRFAKALALIP